MTEAQFERTVLEAARMFGWMVAHFRPAETTKGWRTAVSGDGKGFPDLVLVKNRVLFVELKTDTGKLSFDQQVWRSRINGALESWKLGAMLVDVDLEPVDPFVHLIWRPKEWPRIEEVLRG